MLQSSFPSRSINPIWIICSVFSCALPSCGPDGGGDSIRATDCANLDADVALSLDSAGSRSAAAITSQCEELAVFSDPESHQLTGVAVSLPTDGGSEQAQVLIDQNGVPVAIRTNEGDATLSLNGVTGAVRINVGGQNPASGTFAVDRQELDPALRQTRQSGGFRNKDELCGQLAVTDAVLKAILDPCDGPDTPAYCGSRIEDSARAVSRLCSATDVLQIDQISELQLPDAPEGLRSELTGLGVDGFVVTREAAGGGTTFILTSIIYGGSPPYSSAWAQTPTQPGQTVSLQSLPGNAAVGDSFSRQGSYAFRVTATDESGRSAADEVGIDLDLDLGVAISLTNSAPGTGEAVVFSAVGTNIPNSATYFWTFGDGASGTGAQISHAYDSEAVFSVSVNVTVLGRDLADSVEIAVGEASISSDPESSGQGGTRSSGDFSLDVLLGGPDSLDVGDQRLLEVQATGAIEPVEFGWFILQGPGSIFDAPEAGEQGFAYSATPTLRADAPGIIVVGVVAIDLQGRFAEATRAIPVFGAEGGLYATILGPFAVNPNQPAQLDTFVVGAEPAALQFNWFVEPDGFGAADDAATLESPDGSSNVLTGKTPGFILVGVDVEDSASGNIFTAYFVLEILCGGDEDCFEDVQCPFDYYCDPFCPGFDPDCEQQIECGTANGVCDVFCYFAVESDPDCTNADICAQTGGLELGGACCNNDGFCDPGCPTQESECSGGNIETCFGEGFCCPGDSICDLDCPEPDPECEFCGVDGVCVFGCLGADQDCGGGNDDICAATGFCCNGDGFCDPGCPQVESDCF